MLIKFFKSQNTTLKLLKTLEFICKSLVKKIYVTQLFYIIKKNEIKLLSNKNNSLVLHIDQYT